MMTSLSSIIEISIGTLLLYIVLYIGKKYMLKRLRYAMRKTWKGKEKDQ